MALNIFLRLAAINGIFLTLGELLKNIG